MNEQYMAGLAAQQRNAIMETQAMQNQVIYDQLLGQSQMQAMPSRILGGITPGDFLTIWQEKMQRDVNEWLKDWDG